MTARIAGFVTRAQWGARRPKSVSRNVDPSRGGLGVHYGGSGTAPATHAGCIARWQSWQDFHMDTRGWVDIAYSFGFCQHGYVFGGRGFGVRTAANGTDDGNSRFLAACWVGGAASTPSRQALDALEWITAEVRRLGAGTQVRPHRWFKPTDCPGIPLAAHADRLNDTPLTLLEDDMPLDTDDLRKVADAVWNRALGSNPADGKTPVTAGYSLEIARNYAFRAWQYAYENRAVSAQVENLVGALKAVAEGEQFDEDKLLAGIREATAQGILDAGRALDAIQSSVTTPEETP